jgi:hypothetical protein
MISEKKWFMRLQWHVKELNKTLSNEPSHYSSKRLERMLLFVSANIIVDIGTIYLLFHDKLDWVGLGGIYAAKMVYAGFQTKQISKDVKPNE